MILKRWFKGSDMPTARLLIVCWVCSGVAIDSVASAEIDFNRDVAPILVERCLECHNEHEAMGGLVLTTRAKLVKGGDGGGAFSVTKPQESLLLQRVVA
ncbi:MAG: putative CXXCH cytochrome family protein, partial [Porticoccaceae bacterium]